MCMMIALISIVSVVEQAAALEPCPIPALSVNLSLTHCIVDKARDAGEADLLKLCRQSSVEESFVFVEFARGPGIWVECGLKERAETTVVDLSVLPAIQAIGQVQRLSFYHHHPVERTGQNDFSQTPSGKDIEGFLSILEQVHEVLPAIPVDFRVVTSTGIYRFAPDPALATDRQAKLSLFTVADRIEAFRMSQRVYLAENRRNFGGENAAFARTFSSRHLAIGFELFESPLIAATSEARPTGILVRDLEGTAYAVYHNEKLERLILVHPTLPYLYDEQGTLIGYVGEDGVFVFAAPPSGWPAGAATSILLDLYDEVVEKLTLIKHP